MVACVAAVVVLATLVVAMATSAVGLTMMSVVPTAVLVAILVVTQPALS